MSMSGLVVSHKQTHSKPAENKACLCSWHPEQKAREIYRSNTMPGTCWRDAALKGVQMQSLGDRFVKTVLFQLWLEKLKSGLRGSLMGKGFASRSACCKCSLQHFSQVWHHRAFQYKLRFLCSYRKRTVGMEVIKLAIWSDSGTKMQLWGKGTDQGAISVEMVNGTSLVRSIMQEPMGKPEPKVFLKTEKILDV